ncbi:MAG: tetratricopeptide repeat protein [Alphaproteobacteria bacterium]|nr:tetratricopeptide repeat protein [Alphaproteobacteria bacterium]
MTTRNRHTSGLPQPKSAPVHPRPAKDADAALNEAAHLMIDNKTQKAERILRKLLKAEPDNAEALHLAGVARYRTGKSKRARDLVQRAIRIAPDVSTYHVTLGDILEEAHETALAIAAYERAVLLDPMDGDTYFALANALKRLGHLEEAIKCYKRALEITPDDAPTLYNLGNAFKDARRFAEAVDAYRLALSAQPGFVDVYKNLGVSLTELGRTEEAFAVLRTGAINIFGPDNLSDEALRHPLSTSNAKLLHDAEQIDYLIAHTKIPKNDAEHAQTYRQLIETGPASRLPTESFQMPAQQQKASFRAYNRLVYLNEAPRCDGGAVNPKLDTDAIEKAYQAGNPEIVYFDDFLTQEALQRLREFCLESTIWYTRYDNGYLGAMLGNGFASPLLAQIVDEMPQALPGIFGNHKLKQAWAFKYDSRLSGINMHADFAAVNVNFWITPDDALEDDEAGGLIVWDKEAPLDWNFEKYNSDQEAMRRFLDETDAKPVRIPYRQNRTIIFNSDLFHETDRIAFRPGYENRRINVTLLYGDRRNA